MELLISCLWGEFVIANKKFRFLKVSPLIGCADSTIYKPQRFFLGQRSLFWWALCRALGCLLATTLCCCSNICSLVRTRIRNLHRSRHRLIVECNSITPLTWRNLPFCDSFRGFRLVDIQNLVTILISARKSFASSG